jgi:hypothetical protein
MSKLMQLGVVTAQLLNLFFGVGVKIGKLLIHLEKARLVRHASALYMHHCVMDALHDLFQLRDTPYLAIIHNVLLLQLTHPLIYRRLPLLTLSLTIGIQLTHRLPNLVLDKHSCQLIFLVEPRQVQ